jgi:hypothetical protein
MGPHPTAKGKTSFFELVQDASIIMESIKFNHTVWARGELDLDTLDVVPIEQVREKLYLQPQTDAKSTEELFLTRLSILQEFAFQKQVLSPWGLRHFALDTSQVSSGVDFKYPKLVDGVETFTNNAIPDLTSKILLMWFEIKDTVNKAGTRLTEPDWEVLKQAQERVLTRIRLSAFVRRAFCFAATGFSAWVVSVFRDDEMKASLTFTRVAHKDVEVLWDELSSAGRNPYFFLNEDAPHIWHALKALDLQPALCRVRFVAKSCSSVYALTPPHAPHGFTLGIARYGAETLALKVVHNAQEFDLEAGALREISVKDTTHTFYALGAVSFSKSTTNFLFSAKRISHEAVPRVPLNTDGDAWWNNPFTQSVPGGTVLMRVADRSLTTLGHLTCTQLREVARGVMWSLEMAHSLQLTQCDVRISNVLHFPATTGHGGSWQLVDFGRCSRGEAFDLDCHTNQARDAGQRVQALVVRARSKGTSGSSHVRLIWAPQDDYQMLLRLLLSDDLLRCFAE